MSQKVHKQLLTDTHPVLVVADQLHGCRCCGQRTLAQLREASGVNCTAHVTSQTSYAAYMHNEHVGLRNEVLQIGRLPGSTAALAQFLRRSANLEI